MESSEFRSLKGLRVLVVDDDHISQQLTSQILRQWQVDADMAANGKLALEMLSRNAYDVVMMDLMMPEMDGYEATRTIRSQKEPYFRTLPIFAFSATPDMEKIMACEMNGLISKSPIYRDELYRKISPFLKTG